METGKRWRDSTPAVLFACVFVGTSQSSLILGLIISFIVCTAFFALSELFVLLVKKVPAEASFLSIIFLTTMIVCVVLATLGAMDGIKSRDLLTIALGIIGLILLSWTDSFRHRVRLPIKSIAITVLVMTLTLFVLSLIRSVLSDGRLLFWREPIKIFDSEAWRTTFWTGVPGSLILASGALVLSRWVTRKNV